MKTIYVAGSVNQDIVVSAERAPRPGETVFGTDLEFFPGGKGANQAVAARRLGGRVRFAGKVGADAFGAEMRRYLAGHGLAEDLVESDSEPTGTALIVVAEGGENSITVVSGANATLTAGDCAALDGAAGGDLLVLQNEIPLETTLELLARARRRGMTTIFNAAPAVRLPESAWGDLDLVVVNEHEYATFFGEKLAPGSPLHHVPSARLRRDARAVDAQARQTGLGIVLTLGAAGAVGAVGGQLAEVSGRLVKAVDTTGAGDCFTGALAVALAEGRVLASALAFANAAASLAVTRKGASASFPDRAAVDRL